VAKKTKTKDELLSTARWLQRNLKKNEEFYLEQKKKFEKWTRENNAALVALKGFFLFAIALVAITGHAQTAAPQKVSSPYDVALKTWSEDHMDSRTRMAEMVFDGKPRGDIDSLTFKICMDSIRLERLDEQKRPTPAHVQKCDHLINVVEQEVKALPKW
jgi:hypothetical protein